MWNTPLGEKWLAWVAAPPPPLRERRPCQSNSRCCFCTFLNHVLLCPYKYPPPPPLSIFWEFSIVFKGGWGACLRLVQDVHPTL